MTIRLRWIGALVAALALASASAAASQRPEAGWAAARSSANIYFYSNIGNPIGDPYLKNPLAVEPTTLLLHEDGSWVLAGLRWTGWGSSVAHATGISSESSCSPNCASGKRKTDPAQVTLSHPISLLSHQVYGCFQMTIPASPQANQHLCIKREKVGYGYSPVGAPAPAPASQTDVRFYTPSRNIQCEIYDNGGPATNVAVGCLMYSPQASVNLGLNGHATICQHKAKDRCTGNFGDGPAFRALPYGASATAGRFRCASATNGVTCVVTATGEGFFISRQSVKPVG